MMEMTSVKSNTQQVETIEYMPRYTLAVSFITITTGCQLLSLECSLLNNNELQNFPCSGESAPIILFTKKTKKLISLLLIEKSFN